MSRNAVANPSRAFAVDSVSPTPLPGGGDNGVIAVPGRTTAAEGQGFLEHPSRVPTTRGGARGIIAANVRYTPAVDVMTPNLYNNVQGAPRAWFAGHYVRHFVSSGVAVLARMAMPGRGEIANTLNRASDDSGAPGSPIPVGRRFLTQAFQQPFGGGRIWNDYLQRPEIQAPVGVRRALNRGRIPRMTDPYQPRLTRLAAARSYSQGTKTLAPDPAAASAGSPWATSPAALGRFGA